MSAKQLMRLYIICPQREQPVCIQTQTYTQDLRYYHTSAVFGAASGARRGVHWLRRCRGKRHEDITSNRQRGHVKDRIYNV